MTTATAEGAPHQARFGDPCARRDAARRVAVRITGVVKVPRDPRASYWASSSGPRRPVADPAAQREASARLTGSAGSSSRPTRRPRCSARPATPSASGSSRPTWAPSTRATCPPSSPRVAYTENGPGLLDGARGHGRRHRGRHRTSTRFITGYQELRSRIGPVVSVAAYGTGTVACVVLLMAGGLAADRRRTEFTVLRVARRFGARAHRAAARRDGGGGGARGRGRTRARAARSSRTAARRTPCSRPPRSSSSPASRCPCAPPPPTARRGGHGARDDLAPHAPRAAAPSPNSPCSSWRRRRWSRCAAGGRRAPPTRRSAPAPPATWAAPATNSSRWPGVGRCRRRVRPGAGCIRCRCAGWPAPQGGCAARRLSVAGQRGPRDVRAGPTVLPLLALLTALTTAAFGGSVLAGVDGRAGPGGRARRPARTPASSRRAPCRPPSQSGSARHPAYGRSLALSITYEAKPGAGVESVPLAGVDPEGYARLAGRTGLGAFPADELKAPPADGPSKPGTDGGSSKPGNSGPSKSSADSSATPGTDDSTMPGTEGSSKPDGSGSAKAPLPALASSAVADRYGTRPFSLRLSDGSDVTVRITLVRDLTPALPGTDFLIVDRAGLGTVAARPTTLLVTGDAGERGCPAQGCRRRYGVGRRRGRRYRCRRPCRRTAAFGGTRPVRRLPSPDRRGTRLLGGGRLGSGYAVLTLLLALARAAPERTALLARLRTMGLTRRQARRLLVLEALPQAVLAAAGGTLTGWAAIRLLAPGIDLTATGPGAGGAPGARWHSCAPTPCRSCCPRCASSCSPRGGGRPGLVDRTAGIRTGVRERGKRHEPDGTGTGAGTPPRRRPGGRHATAGEGPHDSNRQRRRRADDDHRETPHDHHRPHPRRSANGAPRPPRPARVRPRRPDHLRPAGADLLHRRRRGAGAPGARSPGRARAS